MIINRIIPGMRYSLLFHMQSYEAPMKKMQRTGRRTRRSQ